MPVCGLKQCYVDVRTGAQGEKNKMDQKHILENIKEIDKNYSIIADFDILKKTCWDRNIDIVDFVENHILK